MSGGEKFTILKHSKTALKVNVTISPYMCNTFQPDYIAW